MNRLIAAAGLLLVSPLLCVGALVVGLTATASTADCPVASTCNEQPPGPGTPFTGPDGYVNDPTSSGQITRRMAHVYDEVNRAFKGWPWGTGCWDPHQWNPSSDHPRGRACDFAAGQIGRFPTPTQRAAGWRLARWAHDNAQALEISYVIWDGHIWSALRAHEGWRRYDGGGIYDPTSPTGGHYDHVHVSVKA